MKTVLLGITGGIAAVKIPELITKLKKSSIRPVILMTHSAAEFVSPDKLEKISGNTVYTVLFDTSFNARHVLEKRVVEHIDLAKHASLYVIAPATANIIAKLAQGIADDYVTTTALAVRCPVLIYPSMNTAMYRHPLTQKNIRTLKSAGYSVYDPSSGSLACGDEGEGRLPPVRAITDEIQKMLIATGDLKGKTVVVTAGGTQEKIDDIRFITNKSSGKTGAAIADACRMRGARVILLRAVSAVSPRYSCDEVIFESSDDLEKKLKIYLPHADICIHAAAVSDYEIKNTFIGKTSSDKPLPLELTPRTKILDTIKNINRNIFLIAFKAEWNVSRIDLIRLATDRLKSSHADMIIANDVSRKSYGFSSDDNSVECIEVNGNVHHIPVLPKVIVAEKIVNLLIRVLRSRRGSGRRSR